MVNLWVRDSRVGVRAWRVASIGASLSVIGRNHPYVPGFRARGLQLYRTLAEISFDNGDGVLLMCDLAVWKGGVGEIWD